MTRDADGTLSKTGEVAVQSAEPKANVTALLCVGKALPGHNNKEPHHLQR